MLGKNSLLIKFTGRRITQLVFVSALLFVSSSQASAFYGLDVNELPRGGDVTVPGDYPIMVRRKGAIQLSGQTETLTLNLLNANAKQAIIQIASPTEKKARILKLNPGLPTIYTAKNSKEITLRVTDGDVTITSMQPLKVQHSLGKNP
jgi:hypothetical protein